MMRIRSPLRSAHAHRPATASNSRSRTYRESSSGRWASALMVASCQPPAEGAQSREVAGHRHDAASESSNAEQRGREEAAQEAPRPQPPPKELRGRRPTHRRGTPPCTSQPGFSPSSPSPYPCPCALALQDLLVLLLLLLLRRRRDWPPPCHLQASNSCARKPFARTKQPHSVAVDQARHTHRRMDRQHTAASGGNARASQRGFGRGGRERHRLTEQRFNTNVLLSRNG